MFYSETLLAKTGPLARVWLSANVERKLSKSHVLSSNINDSVNAIVDRGQAPLALRLSGQLLLGVVRIYSRKARYLLDDCNEAILKIKMAFRPGNVDLPANQSHAASAATLNLPDALTEADLIGPAADLSLLLTQDEDPSLLNFDLSQNLRESVEPGRASSVLSHSMNNSSVLTQRPIEIGRDAARPMQDESTMINDEDVLLEDDGINLDFDEDLEPPKATTQDEHIMDTLDDLAPPQQVSDETIGGMDEPAPITEYPEREPSHEPETQGQIVSEPVARQRSESVLSEPRASVERDLERSFHARESDLFTIEDESFHAPQRATKKRKVLHADVNTQLRNEQIRQQQEDRSKILKPATFLPRDPVLLALMDMQKNGSFVSNILGDGLSKGWAPELRGVLSLEVVRGSGDLKRKRDSAVAGVVSSEAASPVLEFHDAPEEMPAVEPEQSQPDESEPLMRLSIHDGQQQQDHGIDQDDAVGSPAENFDETTMPILHPADDGPVSLGTKHAVHLLRDRLGGADAQGSPTKRLQGSVLFTDLCPERTTTRADATKMFFETLVLATKDAVKIEQPDQGEATLGGALRVRAKRGLWGDWAEMGTEEGREQVTT